MVHNMVHNISHNVNLFYLETLLEMLNRFWDFEILIEYQAKINLT